MIRIRRVSTDAVELAADTRALPSELAARAAPPVEIIRDFADPYLELVRLLREASEIEHALLVQYLYAAYSLKPQYVGLRGPGTFGVATNLLGVAIQEMQHLAAVNRMLVDLDAAPNLVRQDFPYEPDIYPFPLNLEPLTRASVAKYVYTEAPAAALDRDDPANADPATQAFLDQLDAALGGVEPNHLGSLYGTIIARTHEVIAAAIPGLPDLSGWPTILDAIKGEGETEHFAFFRSVFMGAHSAFAGHPDVWSLPRSDPAYPSIELPLNQSAFEGHPNQITDAGQRRRIAWLSNLHYWLVLGLLDLGYRADAADATGQAVSHMGLVLNPLGQHLAGLGVGLPFDPLSMGYNLGRDVAGSVRVLRRLVAETEAVTAELAAVLPPGLGSTVLGQTLAVLDALVPGSGGGGGPGGGGGAPPPSNPAVAMDFWFEFDDHFAFNPPPEVAAVLGRPGLMDLPHQELAASLQAGTFPDGFLAAVTPISAELEVISRHQLDVIDRHYPGDLAGLQDAFELFGQGVLFDGPRRPPSRLVHMMDSPANPIGFRRWHAMIRSMVLLGIDADRWPAIDPLVALAWAVHGEAKPRQNTVNPPLPAARLGLLRAHWLSQTPAQLDVAFSAALLPMPLP
jgi:Ferritin-like